MLSKVFFNKYIVPTTYLVLIVSEDDPILPMIKSAATKGIEYLLIKSDASLRGIVTINTLLQKIDSLSEMRWDDFMISDYYLVSQADMERLSIHEIPHRFILVQKESNQYGIIDLEHTPVYYDQLLQDTISIMDSILDSSYNGIIAIDEDRNIIALNKSAAEICKLNKDQILDRPLREVIPDSPLNYVMFESEPSVQNKYQDGERYIQANRSSLTINSRVVGGISVFQDITNSEETNKELALVKENEKFLESVIANSYDGIYLTDCDGLTLAVNQSYERLTGIDRKHFVGKYMKQLVEQGLLSIYVTDDVVKQKKPVTYTQSINNGKKIIITGSPIFDDAGNVSKVITNARDVTELLNLEKKLSISNEMTNHYQKELFKDMSEDSIICRSKQFSETLELARRVAPKDSSVLILGETGSGKEIVARYIHLNSKRENSHYITINCGSIPANLLESELFGYVAGAFTGASTKGRVGMFELAHEGTLFLDEIGEMPIDLQSSLLRVLQDGEVIRIGDTKSRKVNVRIVAATNRNLEEMIAKGTFRSDLFYRLNVVSIYVPPLRERLDDIPALAEFFINRLNEKYHEGKMITSNFIDQLMKMDWPGNIREMSNFIEKQYVISDDEIINSVSYLQSGTPEEDHSSRIIVNGIIPLNEAVKEVESILIGRAMKKCRTTYKAAELLKISQPTYYRKYKELYKGDDPAGGENEDE